MCYRCAEIYGEIGFVNPQFGLVFPPGKNCVNNILLPQFKRIIPKAYF